MNGKLNLPVASTPSTAVSPLTTPRLAPTVASWTRFPLESGEESKMRLFIFPHAGGRPREYKVFADKLAQDCIEVVVLNFTTTDMITMRNFISAVLDITLYPDDKEQFVDKPFAFFGHSAGAIMAFAIALEMENRGLPRPTRLFASAHPAPHVMERLPEGWADNDELMKDLLREWGGTDEAILEDPIALGAFLPSIKAQLRVVDSYTFGHDDILESRRTSVKSPMGGLAPSYPSFMDTDTHSFHRYKSGGSVTSGDTAAPMRHQKIGIAMHILTGEKDETMKEEDADAWGTLSLNEYSMTKFPGDHFYHLNDGFEPLLAHLSAALDDDIRTHEDTSKKMLEVWNSETVEWPQDDLLHEWFARQAKVYADRVAVVCQTTNREYTYREIDDLSDRLAAYLRTECGVGVDDVTAIFMEHCAEFVIAYIAALKAGGAYIPLEIVYPHDLLERVVETSEPRCVLTKKNLMSRLPSWQKMFDMNTVAELPEATSSVVCDPRPTPDSLAYVVMSSGTTGMPKGIMCPHKGAVHSYHWRLQKYPYEKNERIACHVFFVWELLRPMLGGATTYVIPDDIIFDPEALTLYIERNQITRILFTPSLLQLILDSVDEETLSERLKSLKIVWLCGEVVTIELRNRFVMLQVPCRLLNLYSVSECHDVSASDLSDLADPWENHKYSSCGKLIPNVRAYILDDELKTVPIGAPGELYVAGPVLARGYLKMPEKTAERFVENPFVPGTLMYQTGDRGRFLPSGALELMGRCDFMVKIRGYSVVLGAVEAALGELPHISSAVVQAVGAEGEDKKLVAYIVPENWKEVPTEAEVRRLLKGKLPHYAIPSVFVLMDALPIHSASGKTDRKQLPPVDEAPRLDPGQNNDEGALTATQKALRDIWADMLNIDALTIGPSDSFFEVGGHSLLATKLLARIKHLGNEVSLPALLKNATLVGLAAAIDEGSAGAEIFNLEEEAELDDSIYPAATRKAGYSRFRQSQAAMRPQRVFLTGATGFLGAHILYQLLKGDQHVVVYCLLRVSCDTTGMNEEDAHDATHDAGMRRLLDQMASQNLDVDSFDWDFKERVIPVAGDLSKPLLGLNQSDFRDLATEVDAVIHSGAEVNLVKPYDGLKQSNVLGTQEVLRLCVTNSRYATRVKPLHYVSTNAVFPSSMKFQKEDEDLTNAWKEIATDGDGYAQTKWVAEQMVIKARSRGLPCAVYRPGNMAPSMTGRATWNPRDFYYLALKGCQKLHRVPAETNWRFDMTPVDFAAESIAHLCVKAPHRSLGQVFHLQSPYPPLEAAKMFGASTWKPTEESEWKKHLAEDGTLETLNVALESFEPYFKTPATFDSTELIAALDGTDIKCPELDQHYISRLLDAL